jgi:hypothetical protein
VDRDIRVLGLGLGLGFVALAAAILMPALAAAQAPATAKTPVAPKSEQQSEQLEPNACVQGGGNERATVGQGGDLDMQKPAGRSLSDQLARSDGVICPPSHVDPAIKAPTPPGGPMTVIPPPGSPGGDPSGRPK